MDKRLLTATPKGKERSIFADNSKHVHVGGVGVFSKLTMSGVFASELCWFEFFSLQYYKPFPNMR